MKKFYKIFLLSVYFFVLTSAALFAQDPRLPSVNLGFTNMQAGKSRPPGLYYIQYIQIFQPDRYRGGDGNTINGVQLSSSLVTLQQLAYISDKKIAQGNLGFTVLVPLVKTTPELMNGNGPKVNPSPLGDLVAGPFIQWYDKKLLNLPFAHRLGLNVGFPTGSFDSKYDLNPGSHRFRIFPHYEFTITPMPGTAVSIKNNLYFHFNEIGSPNRPGIAYNLNYAFEVTIVKKLVFEAAGYYLDQLSQDSYQGDHSYYRDTFSIDDTRERVFGIGPGLGYGTLGGLSLELKGMWETSAKNRPEGFRGTILFSYRL